MISMVRLKEPLRFVSKGPLLPVELDRRRPLGLQVEVRVRELIRSGGLQPGAVLPSTRALAADLDVYVTGARHELLRALVSRLLDFTCDGERVLTSKAVRRRGAGRRGAPPASPDYRRSRSELSTTTRLLTDMVTAANAGVSRPSAATGTATRRHGQL